MLYIILATVFYSVALILGAAAARNANTALVTSIMNAVSALLPIALAVPIVIKSGISNQKTGMLYALLAGILLAFFALALNKSYAENKVAIVAPIVFGGSIFLSTALSFLIFKERMSVIQSIGLAVLALGLFLIIYARVTGK